MLSFYVFPKMCNLYFVTWGTVMKYQRADTKRTIIRLEQGANSYMQRAIAARGAFAVLYGRHSKHYIKKTEVFHYFERLCYSVDIPVTLNCFFEVNNSEMTCHIIIICMECLV